MLTCVPALSNVRKAYFITYHAGEKYTLFSLLWTWCKNVCLLGISLDSRVFNSTHNAVVLSRFGCVHPENQAKWSVDQRSSLRAWFSKWIFLCTVHHCPPRSNGKKYGCQQSFFFFLLFFSLLYTYDSEGTSKSTEPRLGLTVLISIHFCCSCAFKYGHIFWICIYIYSKVKNSLCISLQTTTLIEFVSEDVVKTNM